MSSPARSAPLAATIEAAGDSAIRVRVELGGATWPEAHAAVRRLLAALDEPAGRPGGVTDVLPGHETLLVTFDAAEADAAEVCGWIAGALGRSAILPGAPEGRRHVVPVLYHPSVAPDLEALAAAKGLTVDALAAAHAAPEYEVLLLGFRPGFPFLAGLDERLRVERRSTPRSRVAAGSVAIGGRQTGIYPAPSPGGWHIIGRTPVSVFDPRRPDPFLFQVGDRVRFEPIDAARFEELARR